MKISLLLYHTNSGPGTALTWQPHTLSKSLNGHHGIFYEPPISQAIDNVGTAPSTTGATHSLAYAEVGVLHDQTIEI